MLVDEPGQDCQALDVERLVGVDRRICQCRDLPVADADVDPLDQPTGEDGVAVHEREVVLCHDRDYCSQAWFAANRADRRR